MKNIGKTLRELFRWGREDAEAAEREREDRPPEDPAARREWMAKKRSEKAIMAAIRKQRVWWPPSHRNHRW